MLPSLVAYLQTNVGLNALIGTRISADVLPEQSPFPAVVYQVIDAPREHYQPSGAFIGLNRPRIQFKCFGINYASAVLTAAAVIAALEGFMGPMGSPATWMYGILPDNELDDEEAYGVGRLYVRIVDCLVIHA